MRPIVIAIVSGSLLCFSAESSEVWAAPKDPADRKESSSSAAERSKEECLDAHGRGQDLRERGQLARARQLFTTCAQSACPVVVQADCSRMSEDIVHLLPTVTFGARDDSGRDLPMTVVYVDDALIATRLDDGKSYELDPGKHVIRYVFDGRETTNKVVLNQGEKGRVLVATFATTNASGGASLSSRSSSPEILEPVIEAKRPAVPLVFAGIGAAAAVTGAVITGIALSRVPSTCSVGTNECTTSSTDPALGEAKSAVSLANAGLGIGITGVALLVGGIVWYVLSPSHQNQGTRRGDLSSPLFARTALTF